MDEKHEKNVYYYDFTNYIKNISVFAYISLTKQNHEVNIAIISSCKVIIKEINKKSGQNSHIWWTSTKTVFVTADVLPISQI